ncbi:hypothetical protein AAMO2058_001495100 [Amorphochlora amoebiformis]
MATRRLIASIWPAALITALETPILRHSRDIRTFCTVRARPSGNTLNYGRWRWKYGPGGSFPRHSRGRLLSFARSRAKSGTIGKTIALAGGVSGISFSSGAGEGEHKKQRRLILASKSPRRRELLGSLGFEFQVRTQDVDEIVSEEIPPKDVAEYLAIKKANASIPFLSPDEVLVSADTVVLLDDEVLGKPADRKDAINTLLKLSGRSHLVITGVCVLDSIGNKVSFSDVATVTFRELTQREIEYYVDVYKPFDKAGSYGIQDWIGMVAIHRLEGSYYTVMGLPVSKLYSTLTKDFAFDIVAS